jgi:hypothetical protein
MDCGLWTLWTCYIQDVEIKHYTLSGTIFGHLPIAQIHTEKVDFPVHVSLTFYGKGGRWEVILNVYRLM